MAGNTGSDPGNGDVVVEQNNPAPAELSPEDAELKRLEAELQAAEAADAAKVQAEATPPVSTGEAAPKPNAEAEPKDDPRDREIAGLRAALKQERHRRSAAEIEAAEARGRADAVRELARPAEPREPEKTPEERIAELKAEKIRIAEEFDNGKTSAKDMAARTDAIDDQIWAIRKESSNPVQAPQPAVEREDLVLQQATNQIADSYPIVKELSVEALKSFVPAAYEMARREGKPIQGGTALGDLDLRRRIAILATRAFGGTEQPSKTTQPKLSDTAAAREAALGKAERHPPNVADIGRAGEAGEESPASLLNKMNSMSEDDLLSMEKTNPALFRKLAGLE